MIDRSWRVVVADRIGDAGNPEPIGSEDFRSLLDLNRQPLSVVLPIWVDRGPGPARYVLLVQSVKQVMQSASPTAYEIDPLKLAYAEHLFEFLKAHRNDKARVFQLLHQILRDPYFLLYAVLVEGGIGATQEHFHCLVLQCIGDLPAPAVPWLKSKDICKDRVPCGLKARGNPEDKFIIFRRSLTDKQDFACCAALGGVDASRPVAHIVPFKFQSSINYCSDQAVCHAANSLGRI